MHGRRGAHQPPVRSDRAGNASAVHMRCLAGAERIETVGHGASEFGMTRIDAGVDHGDQHVGAARERMRLG